MSAPRKPLRPTVVERCLRLFSDVRPGEGATGLLLLANILLLLTAYYFVKPLRDGWLAVTEFRGLSRIEIKAYSSFAQSLVLLGVVPILGFLASRMSRRTLIVGSSVFFALNLLLFWVFHPDTLSISLPYTGVAFYLWVGIFSVTVVAQFWAFAADVYEPERGKRLFPLVALGATAGAALGSWLAERLVSVLQIEPYDLLYLAIVPLLGALSLTLIVERRGQTGRRRFRYRESEPAAPGEGGVYTLIFQNRYLLAAALLALVVSWVNTNGENILFGLVQRALAESAQLDGLVGIDAIAQFVQVETTAFYGNLYFWVNMCALVLQAFFASRIVKYGGFAAILFFTPIVSFFSYGLMAIFPALAIIRVMKIAENSSHYSAHNTARNLIWLPTSPNTIYKAKSAIDTVFVRAGDALAALTVLVVSNLWGASLGQLIMLNVGLVLIWGGIAWVLVRENERLTSQSNPGSVHV